ncbi:hypothetical protein F5144DRAFT_95529 [Chaetomium tenue]|uniref:Uncharacterized protein n=1 Tax=Chaetomium tenue TaxID=1854479 RepID=A0ACB7PFX3_9PEZI|nr:hypothetical protein F5144DRAFT_95529 [Chaetomium globosum]
MGVMVAVVSVLFCHWYVCTSNTLPLPGVYRDRRGGKGQSTLCMELMIIVPNCGSFMTKCCQQLWVGNNVLSGCASPGELFVCGCREDRHTGHNRSGIGFLGLYTTRQGTGQRQHFRFYGSRTSRYLPWRTTPLTVIPSGARSNSRTRAIDRGEPAGPDDLTSSGLAWAGLAGAAAGPPMAGDAWRKAGREGNKRHREVGNLRHLA